MTLQPSSNDKSESVIGGSPIAQSGVVASRNSTKQNCQEVKNISKRKLVASIFLLISVVNIIWLFWFVDEMSMLHVYAYLIGLLMLILGLILGEEVQE